MKTARQSFTLRTILFLILFCLGSVPVQAQYAGGTGEPNDPYQIASADDLLEMAAATGDWDEHFVLTDDVNMDGHPFTDAVVGRGDVVEKQWSTGTLFTGTFDGNDFAIRNLVLDADGQKRDCVALFGGIGAKGVVKNLKVENAYVVAGDYVAALAGINMGRVDHCAGAGLIRGDGTVGGLVAENRGCILNSLSTGEVGVNDNDIDNENVGGLVGRNCDEATISHCRSACEISGLDRKGEDFGGLVGWNQGAVLHCRSTGSVSGYADRSRNFGGLVGNNEGTVINCYSEGSVINNENVGGLAGRNGGGISNCYSTGSASGNRYVGGLVGYNSGRADNCYSIGAVIGQAGLGGLVGHNVSSTSVKDSFWDINSSGLETSSAGTGLSTSEMKDAGTYRAAGWDFLGEREDGLHETWKMPEPEGYPVLSIFNGYEPAELAGNGTAGDPYRICEAEQLAAVLYGDPKAHYQLACNINLAGIHWSGAILPQFGGAFNGDGLVISNLVISSIDPAGLFGTLYSTAEVRNLGIEDANVAGSNCVGGLAGENNGKIWGCYVTGTVTGDDFVGGLAGDNEGGEVANAYSTAGVKGNTNVGGLVGRSNNGNIRTCFSAGRVRGNADVGGLIGLKTSSAVVAGFWDIETSGWITGNAGMGKTTEQMQTAEAFWSAGWDFVGERENGVHEFWQMPAAGGYPVLSVFNGYAPPQLAGSGTADEPYLISDANELGALVHYDSAASYLLTDDIDLAGITWSTNVLIPEFSGVFDGGDHAILSLHVDIPDSNDVGLFGRLGQDARVENLRIVNARVAGTSSRVGILAGSNQGSVANCRATGNVTGLDYVGGLVGLNDGSVSDSNGVGQVNGNDYVGGLVGRNTGSVTESAGTGEVSGDSHVGGLAGQNGGAVGACSASGVVAGGSLVGGLVGSNTGDVSQCHSDCNEVVGESYVGGLVGDNTGDVAECFCDCNDVIGTSYVGGLAGDNDNGSIADSYHVGSVSGVGKVGGIAGNNPYGAIRSCYSTGAIAGSEDVGGIAGDNTNRVCWKEWIAYPLIYVNKCKTYTGTIENCFWNIDACENDQLRETPDRWAATGSEMRNGDTYEGAGWDFTHIWEMPRIGPPKLRWQSYEEPRYHINNAADLVEMASNPGNWTKYYILTADIDLAGISLERTGNGSINFNGVFDGKGYTISHLSIDQDSAGVGMFGILGSRGVVKNLRLEAVDIWGRREVGGIAGVNYGLIRNCHIEGVVSGLYEKVGGLVGDSDGPVHHCSSAALVSGETYVGGLVGCNGGGVYDCNSAGQVSGNYQYVGGLVGLNDGRVTRSKSTADVAGETYVGGLVGRNTREISYCYSTGSVTGDRRIGGLVGRHSEYLIKHCYATGAVRGGNNSEVGGLIGSRGTATTISASFWDEETSGQTNSAGGTPMATADMQKAETYLVEGWDFADETLNGMMDTWWILEGQGCPRLWWEPAPAVEEDAEN